MRFSSLTPSGTSVPMVVLEWEFPPAESEWKDSDGIESESLCSSVNSGMKSWPENGNGTGFILIRDFQSDWSLTFLTGLQTEDREEPAFCGAWSPPEDEYWTYAVFSIPTELDVQSRPLSETTPEAVVELEGVNSSRLCCLLSLLLLADSTAPVLSDTSNRMEQNKQQWWRWWW